MALLCKLNLNEQRQHETGKCFVCITMSGAIFKDDKMSISEQKSDNVC